MSTVFFFFCAKNGHIFVLSTNKSIVGEFSCANSCQCLKQSRGRARSIGDICPKKIIQKLCK